MPAAADKIGGTTCVCGRCRACGILAPLRARGCLSDQESSRCYMSDS